MPQQASQGCSKECSHCLTLLTHVPALFPLCNQRHTHSNSRHQRSPMQLQGMSQQCHASSMAVVTAPNAQGPAGPHQRLCRPWHSSTQPRSLPVGHRQAGPLGSLGQAIVQPSVSVRCQGRPVHSVPGGQHIEGWTWGPQASQQPGSFSSHMPVASGQEGAEPGSTPCTPARSHVGTGLAAGAGLVAELQAGCVVLSWLWGQRGSPDAERHALAQRTRVLLLNSL